MDQATEDLQGLTISSIEACCTSLRANMPLTDEQMRKLHEIYEQLLLLQRDVASGLPEDNIKTL